MEFLALFAGLAGLLLGTQATIARLDFDADMLRFELPFLFILTSVVLFFLVRESGIQKRQGSIIILMYCTYIVVKLQGAIF